MTPENRNKQIIRVECFLMFFSFRCPPVFFAIPGIKRFNAAACYAYYEKDEQNYCDLE